jgi:hypothetical protein
VSNDKAAATYHPAGQRVWIVWDEVPFEGNDLIAVCASLEAAERAAEPHRGHAFIEITEHKVSV